MLKIILFGSVTRGKDTDESNIDILIIAKNVGDDLKIEDDV
ncbi:MAG: nucleotidyltransferase domain-containing protein [Methanobrevibacter sp.]|nr:nucleotidyltransferase domain-containing protein [Methanobrevibacter sp.]